VRFVERYVFLLPVFTLRHLNEILSAAVIGPFNSIGKETCGQFVSISMIVETVTTYPLPTARIATIAYVFVFLYFAFSHS